MFVTVCMCVNVIVTVYVCVLCLCVAVRACVCLTHYVLVCVHVCACAAVDLKARMHGVLDRLCQQVRGIEGQKRFCCRAAVLKIAENVELLEAIELEHPTLLHHCLKLASSKHLLSMNIPMQVNHT